MAAPVPEDVRFFRSIAEFRRWLIRNGEHKRVLWVGFYTKDSGKSAATYNDAVGEALCFGWIDGVRVKVDADSYTNRFTPRQPRSTWSAVNLRRFEALRAAGRIDGTGLRVFQARNAPADGYVIGDRPTDLDATVEAALRAAPEAWVFFQPQPPWYRRDAAWWVTSAKQPATRERRLATLVTNCHAGQRIRALNPPSRRNIKAG